MKLISTDKLIEWGKEELSLADQILLERFISTNSIEVEQIKTPNNNIYATSPASNCLEVTSVFKFQDIAAIYISKKPDVKDKLIAERIHQDLKAEQAYMEQPNVKTTDTNSVKRCEDCLYSYTENNELKCPDDKWCVNRTNWTPKADKVEGDI